MSATVRSAASAFRRLNALTVDSFTSLNGRDAVQLCRDVESLLISTQVLRDELAEAAELAADASRRLRNGYSSRSYTLRERDNACAAATDLMDERDAALADAATWRRYAVELANCTPEDAARLWEQLNTPFRYCVGVVTP